MANPARKRATYEDLLALPEKVVGEIIAGELVVSPRPGPPHTSASSRLGVKLGAPFDFGDGGPGGWWILDEPEIHFGADVVVPDLAGWRKNRMAELPKTAWFEVAPDWVCEILSPSTARIDRRDKLPLYARAGIPAAWLLDPEARTLEALLLRDGTWTISAVHAGSDVARIPPFDAIAIDLAAIWGVPPEKK